MESRNSLSPISTSIPSTTDYSLKHNSTALAMAIIAEVVAEVQSLVSLDILIQDR
jgi:hypothetical protein